MPMRCCRLNIEGNDAITDEGRQALMQARVNNTASALGYWSNGRWQLKQGSTRCDMANQGVSTLEVLWLAAMLRCNTSLTE